VFHISIWETWSFV